jgi:hypothetical protein
VTCEVAEVAEVAPPPYAEDSEGPKPVGTCAGCGGRMTILFPGQTRHPNPKCGGEAP